MTAWSVLLALIFSLLSDCTASSVQTYEVAKLTFRHGDRIESFFGAYAVPSASPRRALNGTDYHLKIDVENLKNEECKDRESVCDSGSPSYPGAYRVVCDGVSAQRVLNHCSGSGIEHLELLILCVSESRARELLTGEGLRVASQRLTVILVNRSDDHLCPLYNPNYDILESTNVSVTVRYAGMDSFAPTTRPSLYPPFFDQTTTFYFVMFAFCLLLLLALVWFAFNYLKRCHNVLSRRQARLQLQTVTRRAVNHCTVRSYKKSKNLTDGFESEEERCAICLEEYKAKELLRQLACKHEFHKMCVDPWLMDKRTCPLCKLDIVAEFEGREQQQDSHPEVIVGGRAGRSESRSSDDDETAFPFSPDGTPEPDIEAGSVMS